MKNNLFSGFDEIKSTDLLKQKIITSIGSGGIAPPKRHAAHYKWIPAAACFAIIIAASSVVIIKSSFLSNGSKRVTANSTASSKPDKMLMQSTGSAYLSEKSKGFIILKNAPVIKTKGDMARSKCVAPTEQDVYKSASTIVFGEVTDIKWVHPSAQSSEIDYDYRTIVTVKVSNAYKGDVKAGDSVDILLPVCISGDGSGWIEDNENAAKLKKGSKAFFFASLNSKDDYADGESQNLRWSDICKYGIRWGDETIVPEDKGSFNYFFTTNHNLTFDGMEKAIKNVCGGQFAK